MALTATCKKCSREVTPGDICPICGTKLGKNAAHAAWVLERKPVADWMCWNAVMRWLLPAGMVILALALILEGLSGGTEAVERLFLGSFPLTLLMLLGAVLALVTLALALQGKELVDYVVDSRGVHAARYLPDPTPLKLLLRLKSPGMMRAVDPEARTPVLLLDEQDLSWRNVARVQLWPEKCYILFYAPAWWLRIPVRCTPFTWEDALVFVREKLGKKKAVDLPAHLRTQTAVKKAPARRASRPAAVSAAETRPAMASASDGEDWPAAEEEALPAPQSPAPKKTPARRAARPAVSVPAQAEETPAFPEPEEWADVSAYAPDPAADEEGSFPEPAAPEAEDGSVPVSGGEQMTMDLS